MFDGVPDEDINKITHENACRWYVAERRFDRGRPERSRPAGPGEPAARATA